MINRLLVDSLAFKGLKLYWTRTLEEKNVMLFLLTGDFNSLLGIWFLDFLLGHSDSKHPLFHTSLDLICLEILRQFEPSQELATATFNTMPLSFLSSFSTFLSPLTWSTLSSSISTFTSSFLSPGRSALNTWASGVSVQSMRVLTRAEFSRGMRGDEGKGKSLNGSKEENGSKMMSRDRLLKKLGIFAIFSSLFFFMPSKQELFVIERWIAIVELTMMRNGTQVG